MDSTEDSNRRQEIQLSLESIVRTSDKWLGRLRGRESRARLASSLLTAVLIFWAIGATVIGYLVSQHGLSYLNIISHQSNQVFLLAGAAGLAGLIGGFATYFLLKGKHDARLEELSSLITEMKKLEKEQPEKTNNVGGEGITDRALLVADKIMKLLPEMVRRKNQDSLLLGVMAFIVTSVVGGNLPFAIPVGAIVWLYFRYELGKRYEKEISKFEEQKRVFEQRKKDFIETL